MAKMFLRIGKISFCALGTVAVVALAFYGVRFVSFSHAEEGPAIEQEIGELIASAQAHQANGQYAEAEQIYRNIIEQDPDSDYALEAQKNIVLLFINSGNTSVQQEIDALIADFSEHPELFRYIFYLTDEYIALQKYDKAKELYQYVFENCPDNDLAAEGLRWIATCEIKSGNDSAAEQAINTLKTTYSQHPKLFKYIYHFANDYRTLKKIDKAKELYQYAIQNSSDSKAAIRAQKWIVTCEIKSGNDSAAEQAIDTLKNDYTGHPELFTNIYELASYCRKRGKLDQAKELYQYVIQNSSDSKTAIRAQKWVANCEIKSGNDSAAEQVINTLKTTYSQHPELHGYIYYLAKEYRDLQKIDQAKELYQYVFENCPDNRLAARGLRWVADCEITLGNDSAAEQAINMLKTTYSQHPKLSEYIYYLADEYRTLQKIDKAKELYQYAIQNAPSGGRRLLRTYAELAKMDVMEEDFDSANIHCNQILTDFPEDPALDKEVKRIIGAYWEKGDYARVRELSSAVIDRQPDNAMCAQTGLIRTNIVLGNNDPNISEELDELISKFAFNPGLPDAILDTGLAYYTKARYRAMEGDNESEKAFYRDAINIYEKVIAEFGDSDFTGSAYFRAGVLYAQELGEYQKGIDYFEAAIDSRPVYAFAWAAQYLVGKYYEKLRDTGAIERLEANTMIKEAYQGVVENWPDCDWADDAQLKLDRIAFKETNQ